MIPQKPSVMQPSISWDPRRWFCWLLATGYRLRWTALLLIVQGTATFAGTLEVVCPAPEAPGDTRYDHYWQLLAQALAITEPDFGPFTLREATLPMTERRAMEELETGKGTITVLVHGKDNPG
jgi:hypothetical protein